MADAHDYLTSIIAIAAEIDCYSNQIDEETLKTLKRIDEELDIISCNLE